MSNKFKVKKKLVSIALALALGVQPLASLPMNVFAGTGKNGVIMAPTVETNFELDNIIELKAGETFNVNNYVKNIQPQGANVNYQFESLLAFEAGAVLVDDGKVTNPWIAKVKVTVGVVSKETYIIANINGILNAANAANAAYYAAQSGEFFDAYVGYGASYSLARAANCADTSDDEIGNAAIAADNDAGNAANGAENSTSGRAPFPDRASPFAPVRRITETWDWAWERSRTGRLPYADHP